MLIRSSKIILLLTLFSVSVTIPDAALAQEGSSTRKASLKEARGSDSDKTKKRKTAKKSTKKSKKKTKQRRKSRRRAAKSDGAPSRSAAPPKPVASTEPANSGAGEGGFGSLPKRLVQGRGKAVPSTGKNVKRAEIRDPFSPAPRVVFAAAQVEEAIRLEEERQQAEERRRLANPEFTPIEFERLMPKIVLRGYMESEEDQPLAIIEILNAGVFLVRETDTISVQNRDINTVLRIKELSNLSVHVEIGTLGRVIVVR